MPPEYKVGSVIESGDNWTQKGLTIAFERAATMKGFPGKIAPHKKFVIEEIRHGSISQVSGIGSDGDTAVVSQLRGHSYDPNAPKLTVKIKQEYTDASLSGQKVPVIGRMKIRFADFTPE